MKDVAFLLQCSLNAYNEIANGYTLKCEVVKDGRMCKCDTERVVASTYQPICKDCLDRLNLKDDRLYTCHSKVLNNNAMMIIIKDNLVNLALDKIKNNDVQQ